MPTEEMIVTSDSENATPVRERLLQAARDCFLQGEFHRVSTRQIAAAAGVNVSMIRYYFGNKLGLYDEMIRETLQPLLDVLDGQMLSSRAGFAEFFALYYHTMSRNPTFPRLILKVLALNQGPGRRFIQQLLERGRTRGARVVNRLQAKGDLGPEVDADILRIAFVSLAMTPMLLKDVFEEQTGNAMDDAFLERLATFNGRLFATGLAPKGEQE